MAGLLAFALQVIAPTPPAVPKPSDFLAFVMQSGIADWAGPGHTIDLCSQADGSDQPKMAHTSCPLCLVSGIPPGRAVLVEPLAPLHPPIATSPSQQVCGQRTWPTELATGPPQALSV
jgi:hypothetical protein